MLLQLLELAAGSTVHILGCWQPNSLTSLLTICTKCFALSTAIPCTLISAHHLCIPQSLSQGLLQERAQDDADHSEHNERMSITTGKTQVRQQPLRVISNTV